ncbi:MAG: hypothetical protein EXQ84_00390 [Rhodospirillaceae bacterium]|nr:hypothetical protein [Rhodospirillaceae bacterium]
MFRIGPAFGTPYPDTQFPLEAKGQYFAQLVPMTDGSTTNDTPKGLAALVDRIGPAIIFGHSMSGVLVLQAAEMRPDLVKVVVLLEASSCAVDAAKLKTVWAHIPVLTIWGDHIDADPGRGRQREQCQALVASINAAGGHASLISLPAIGIKGNGHIMIVEKNNLQIAGLVEDWLSKLPR